jgi:hypothetical protein
MKPINDPIAFGWIIPWFDARIPSKGMVTVHVIINPGLGELIED